jgi:hypothetical protein
MRSLEDGSVQNVLDTLDSTKNREIQNKVDTIMAAIIDDPTFKTEEILHDAEGNVAVRDGNAYREVTLNAKGKPVIGEVVPFEPKPLVERPPRQRRQPHPEAKDTLFK